MDKSEGVDMHFPNCVTRLLTAADSAENALCVQNALL